MHVHRKFLVVFCILNFMIAGPTFSDTPDPDTYYRLSTKFRGSDMSLDVFNGGPKNNFVHLVRTRKNSGQFWKFVSNGDGTFKLTTQFTGPSKCLDVVNGGENDNEPHLTECGNFSGQRWIVVSDGRWVRLKTKFRGDGMCLDIFNGGPKNDQPYLKPCGSFSGQRWRLQAVTPQVVRKICRWFGTAPGCDGECPGGWSFSAKARTESEAKRIESALQEKAVPSFGEPCVPFTAKALCCQFQ
jgi:Ricin-type beta-trefoil lectin domain